MNCNFRRLPTERTQLHKDFVFSKENKRERKQKTKKKKKRFCLLLLHKERAVTASLVLAIRDQRHS
jgi:hypothetical protein